MPARIRLAIWGGVALVLSIGQCAWLLIDRERRWPAVAGFELAAVAMIVLLLTTPAHAIRLKRIPSEGLILAGTLALQLSAGSRGGHLLLVLLTCMLLLVISRMAGKSAWWVVPLAWNPLLLAITAG